MTSESAVDDGAATRSAGEYGNLLRRKIDDLRARLLNLTLTNKLLNFSHSDRSRGFVRVVDELADVLFGKLLAGAMSFRPLPSLEEDLPDELADEFLRAVDAARMSDEQYRLDLEALEKEGEVDDAGERSEAIERALKDRLRVALGMPPRQTADSVSLVEHAHLHGISPSFDLPGAEADPSENRWQDRNMQLLLLPETAERKLSGLLDLTNEYLQETGINTLFGAFGFLQWYEDATSTTPRYAPLLLLPLEIKRRLVSHEYVYAVAGSDEDPQSNLSLKEKLRADFGLALPELEEDEQPVAYMARVAEAVAREKRWRVRNWVTIGIFPFARMALYHDLDLSRWPGQQLLEHEIVSEMLVGRKSGAEENETEVDDEILAAKLPLLITDADSSQAGAIIDGMERSTLVVKGPPGTGKSQTITNLIAAALDKGERVLFVAEKLAALKVVYSRLEEAGLGHFCLELHSEKARKADVLRSLKARLDMPADAGPASLDAKLDELTMLRNELNAYARLLNTPLGRSEMTAHDVLWAARRAQDNAGSLPERFQKFTVKNATELTPDSINRAKGIFEAVEAAYRSMARGGADLATHPWRGAGKSSLTPFDVEEIGDALITWRKTLENLGFAVDSMAQDVGWAPPASEAGVPVAVHVANLIDPGQLVLRLPFLPTLQDRSIRQAASEFMAHLSERMILHESLTHDLGSSIGVLPEDLERIGELATSAQCGGMTPPVLERTVTDLQGKIKDRRDAEASAEELATNFGHFEGLRIDELAQVLAAAALVSASPREVLAARTIGMLEENVRAVLERGRDESRRLTDVGVDLGAAFHIERRTKPEELEAHASALRNAGALRFLSGRYRRAKRFYRDYARGHHKNHRSVMARDLDDAAQMFRDRQKLASDPRLVSICGARFEGLRTDFDLLVKALDFLESARTRFGGIAQPAQRLRTTLLEGDIAVLDGIRTLTMRPAFDVMRRVVADEGEGAKYPLRQITTDLESRLAELTPLRIRISNAGLYGKDVRLSDLPGIAAKLRRLRELTAAIGTNLQMRRLMGQAFAAEKTDASGLADSIAYSERLMSSLPPELSSILLTENLPRLVTRLQLHAQALVSVATAMTAARQRFGAVLEVDWQQFFDGSDVTTASVAELQTRLKTCDADRAGLADWSALLDTLGTARKHGLNLVLDVFLEDRRPLVGLYSAYELVIFRSMAREAYQLDGGILARHSGINHEAVRQRFRELDHEILNLNRKKLSTDLLDRLIPYGVGRGPKSSYTDRALIEHEVGKKVRHIPLRDLVRRAGNAIQALKPCFMMSPLSIAQYIPPGSLKFDLLVIDEASQMKPEEAIGAFARSRRAVVVGDPQQLPPTSFFERNLQAPVDEAEQEEEKIANESILDLALAAFRPARTLRWHYRSRHDSLIAFSNRHFYGNELIVFPTPDQRHPDFGVGYRHVAGIYESGTNPVEVAAVCAAAIDFMYRHPDRSLGIVALNQAQRELIREDIERLIAADDRARIYVAHWADTLEPFFVKNLENVQGDERDAIFISTVYGPDRNGIVMQRFGPINSVNGHRRLNVLFSRAKLQTVVFSSMTASQIRAEPSSSRGVHALKGYLEYAATGRLDAGSISEREPDSDFEVWVAEQIRTTGCEAVAQVGVAGYFIDIGVRHPSYPHGFLLGVECDGAMYHSGKAARDRDRLRQEVLEARGWDIHRIWSTDWFRNPNGEVEKLRQRIQTAISRKTPIFGDGGIAVNGPRGDQQAS